MKIKKSLLTLVVLIVCSLTVSDNIVAGGTSSKSVIHKLSTVTTGNAGVIFVGESHNYITETYVATDLAEFNVLNKTGCGYYKSDLAGYKKNVDLFFVNTGLSNEMGSTGWLGGNAINLVQNVIEQHSSITDWNIFVQHGASSCTKSNENSGVWGEYQNIYPKWVKQFGKVYVMSTPPINEKNWKIVFKDNPDAVNHNNVQVQKFNSYLKNSVCDGKDIVYVDCYSEYIGMPFADKSVGVTSSAVDPNHYAASAYASITEYVLLSTVGKKGAQEKPEEESEESETQPTIISGTPEKPGLPDKKDDYGFEIESSVDDYDRSTNPRNIITNRR